MAPDNTITLYKWILKEFTIAERGKAVRKIGRHLAPLIRPADKVLDLCCGTGPASFWFEERGAAVTAIDFAPYMIALARDEASKRNSLVEFIEGDIFIYDFGQDRYDLVACLGNSISDFSLSAFMALGKKVAKALKPGGRFVLQYHDGFFPFIHKEYVRSGVIQEAPERVTFYLKEYLPEKGAYVAIYRNETLGEEYQRIGYIYSVPMVHSAMDGILDIEQHIVLDADQFLDAFTKPGK